MSRFSIIILIFSCHFLIIFSHSLLESLFYCHEFFFFVYFTSNLVSLIFSVTCDSTTLLVNTLYVPLFSSFFKFVCTTSINF